MFVPKSPSPDSRSRSAGVDVQFQRIAAAEAVDDRDDGAAASQSELCDKRIHQLGGERIRLGEGHLPGAAFTVNADTEFDLMGAKRERGFGLAGMGAGAQ